MIQPQAAPQLPQAQPTVDDGALLERIRRMFESAQDHAQTWRERSLSCQAYYDGDQWTDAERRVLRERKQPDTVFNRIKPAINGIIGVVERGRTDPKAWPRTEKDIPAAEVATDALRFVADRSRFQHIKMRGFRDFLIWGVAAAIVVADEQGECKIVRVRPEEFFFDAYSREEDFTDARYMGIGKWMDVKDVQAMYRGREAEIEAAANSNWSRDESYEDRPKYSWAWADQKRKRAMLVEMYHIEQGVWQRSVFMQNLVLESGPSPFVDAMGNPRNPIAAVSAYVDQDNRRYGVVWDMIGPQDEINKRRSKALHLLTMRQSRISRAMGDAELVRRELAKPDGVVQADKDEFDILPTGDLAAGHINLLQEAKNEIERQGPNPGVLGREVQGQSGRAILAQQQAGLIELAPLFAANEDWVLRLYRGVWDCIKQYWDAERWIRVTDDENAPRFIGLNVPIETQVDPMTMQPVVTKMQNPVSMMDVDITVDSTPDTGAIQEEQWTKLVELVQAGVQIPPDALIEASNLPRKRQILDRMRQPPEGPTPQEQMAMRGGEADVRLKEAKATEAEAKAAAMLSPMGQMPLQQPMPAAEAFSGVA